MASSWRACQSAVNSASDSNHCRFSAARLDSPVLRWKFNAEMGCEPVLMVEPIAGTRPNSLAASFACCNRDKLSLQFGICSPVICAGLLDYRGADGSSLHCIPAVADISSAAAVASKPDMVCSLGMWLKLVVVVDHGHFSSDDLFFADIAAEALNAAQVVPDKGTETQRRGHPNG